MASELISLQNKNIDVKEVLDRIDFFARYLTIRNEYNHYFKNGIFKANDHWSYKIDPKILGESIANQGFKLHYVKQEKCYEFRIKKNEILCEAMICIDGISLSGSLSIFENKNMLFGRLFDSIAIDLYDYKIELYRFCVINEKEVAEVAWAICDVFKDFSLAVFKEIYGEDFNWQETEEMRQALTKTEKPKKIDKKGIWGKLFG